MNIKEIEELKIMIADPRLDFRRSPLAQRSLVLSVLAFEYGKGGLLPPLQDCATHLNISLKNLKKTLHHLSRLGWMRETAQGWVATRLQESPAPSGSGQSAIRYARKRHRAGAQDNRKEGGAPKQATPYYD
jgi:hypothetical protein